MNCRWSNGHSRAVEFDSGSRAEWRLNLLAALQRFRREHGAERVELHVEAQPGQWTDPIICWGIDEETKRLVANLHATNMRPGFTMQHGGYSHVININDRQPADLDGRPRTRGTDCVLIGCIAASEQVADILYLACVRAIGYAGSFAGFGQDIVDAVRGITGESR